jgi:hypothetical protein
MVAARLATLKHGQTKKADAPIGASAQPEAAKALGVGHGCGSEASTPGTTDSFIRGVPFRPDDRGESRR